VAAAVRNQVCLHPPLAACAAVLCVTLVCTRQCPTNTVYHNPLPATQVAVQYVKPVQTGYPADSDSRLVVSSDSFQGAKQVPEWLTWPPC
jgi:hypothetical protein